MPSKPIGGARQAAIEASAKRHALNAAEKPSKHLKTDHYPDAIPKDDLYTNIGVGYGSHVYSSTKLCCGY